MGQDITTGVTAKTASSATNSNTAISTSAGLSASSAVTKYQFLTPASTDSTSAQELGIDDIFSYEDYMKFLDIFLNDDDDKEKDEEKQNYNNTIKDTTAATTPFTSSEISYNVPVMNLLKEQKLI